MARGVKPINNARAEESIAFIILLEKVCYRERRIFKQVFSWLSLFKGGNSIVIIMLRILLSFA